MKVVSIFGNVGAGKTTLLKNLEKEHYTVYYEPQEFWNPFFKLYMKDPSQWAAAFQMIVLKGYEEMYKQIMSENDPRDPNKVIFIERGLECCTAFCKWLLHKNQLSKEQMEAIEEYKNQIKWFDNIEYVYLKEHPAICASRALERENELNPCDMEYMNFLNAEWEKRDATHVVSAMDPPEYVLEDFKKVYAKTDVMTIRPDKGGYNVEVEGDLPYDLEPSTVLSCHRSLKPVYSLYLTTLPESIVDEDAQW